MCGAGNHRSALECRSAAILGPAWDYEPIGLTYTTRHVYTPDFVHLETKTIRETKGLFDQADRSKMKIIKAAYPDWRIIMVFQDPYKRISKTSKTTYAQWCDKNGIEWEIAK